MKLPLRRRHAQIVKNCASSHETNYIFFFFEIQNLVGHSNCCIGSKVTMILLNGWILSTGGVALGRVCACSLHRRLVKIHEANVVEIIFLFVIKKSFVQASSSKEVCGNIYGLILTNIN